MAGEDFTSRARARARVAAAEFGAARRRAAALFPNVSASAEHFGERLRALLKLEIAPGRLMPWLPIGFGVGIVLYFTADQEPARWAAIGIAALTIACAVFARRHFLVLACALAVASIACGFAVATIKTSSIAHPVLRFPVTAEVKGFVEVREERERSDRIVVHVTHMNANHVDKTPERVRVAVRKGTAPAVGDFVAFRARLLPPLGPLRPGGYDFARDMFFQNIGASGYVFGRIKTEPPPVRPDFALRYHAFIDGVREQIDDRIKENLSGDRGSIASALITGKRDAISTPVNDAMYVSSLAHVLSISGYHMAVVAGAVFFVLRALLALFPGLATRRPIKKWAAIAALVAATLYLLLSGAEVATQRSYIMIAIVLVGVMFDRPALTFRTLAVAAFAVLLLAPQAVVHPSFQMSFAATLVLVAGYQLTLPWQSTADSSLTARAALWGVREITGLIFASLLAGLATTPYAAFHFHRLAPYGVLANLLAMPVVSGWVMPMGILGVIALPFGFDAPFWRLMGVGIDWMTAVAQWVAHLPGAVGRVAAFGVGPLLLASAGLVVTCLLRTRLRWAGAAMIALATVWVSMTPQPDIYIAGDGQTAAIRGANGHLSILQRGRDTFAIKEWLAADADSRAPGDKTLTNGVKCDDAGCVARLPDGRPVAMPLTIEALLEDCERAAVVASSREAPTNKCEAALFDRNILRERGAVSLRIEGSHFAISATRPTGYNRPWAERPQRKVVPQPDATPPVNRLEPDDY